jgi:hypothetical protein
MKNLVVLAIVISGGIFAQKKSDSTLIRKMPKLDSTFVFDANTMKTLQGNNFKLKKSKFPILNSKPDTSLYKMPTVKVNSNGLLALKSNTDLSKVEKVLPKMERAPRINPKVEK